MGCGSSSLKGEGAGGGLSGDAPQPIRKVNTNFSTIDYEAEVPANQRRRMTEYAPDETVRSRSEASGVDPNRSTSIDRPPPPIAGQTSEGPGGEKLEPYHTINDTKDMSYPHEMIGSSSQPNAGVAITNGSADHHNNNNNIDGLADQNDPTTAEAKDRAADRAEPINNQRTGTNSNSLSPPADGEAGKENRRKSWIDKFRSGKENREISDEEMKKYTGMTNAEMKEYARTGEGVGADRVRGITPLLMEDRMHVRRY